MADPTEPQNKQTSSTSSPSSTSPKTPAERIQELSSINTQIPLVLKAAGIAISALTNAPRSSPDDTSFPEKISLSTHKQIFQSSARTFFTLLNSISVSLQTQAQALEAANIIPALPMKRGREPTAADLAAIMGGGPPPPGPPPIGGAQGLGEKDSEADVKNSGLGNLDIGWLNSRAGAGDVGDGMQREVLGRVREILEGMVGEEKDGEDERMIDG